MNASLLSPKVTTDSAGFKGMQSPLNTMNQTRDSFNALTPTGLKGKLASLEDFISMQNEELAAQRQAEHRAALPGAAAGAEEDHGGGRAAHAGGGQAPLRAPEGGELPPPAADHHAQGREDEPAAADPGPSAPHPGDRGGQAPLRA